MIKSSYIRASLCACVVSATSFNVFSSEQSLVANIKARAEYDDNIFLTDQEHDAVTGLIITPSITGVIKEVHWETRLDASLRINKYSDNSLDGNDQFFNLSGSYNVERNIFSLNVNHDLDSNLNSTSTDFGLVGVRTERKRQSITPQYTRLLTERSVLVLSYTYTDVDYQDADNTGFTPFVTENLSGSLLYDLTERDKLTFTLSAVDYRSKNDLVTYQLFTSRIGVDHKFTETLSTDFSAGVSRQNSTNLQTQGFDFFGRPIAITRQIDASNRGLVFNAGIKQLLETGQIEGRIGRDDRTNSFGGLDVVNRVIFSYTDKLSALWRYNVNSRFENIKSLSSGSTRSDRNIFSFESVVYYSIAPQWDLNASYRFVSRRFKSDTSENRAPHSNRIYFGLTYNFPPLSTF